MHVLSKKTNTQTLKEEEEEEEEKRLQRSQAKECFGSRVQIQGRGVDANADAGTGSISCCDSRQGQRTEHCGGASQEKLQLLYSRKSVGAGFYSTIGGSIVPTVADRERCGGQKGVDSSGKL